MFKWIKHNLRIASLKLIRVVCLRVTLRIFLGNAPLSHSTPQGSIRHLTQGQLFCNKIFCILSKALCVWIAEEHLKSYFIPPPRPLHSNKKEQWVLILIRDSGRYYLIFHVLLIGYQLKYSSEILLLRFRGHRESTKYFPTSVQEGKEKEKKQPPSALVVLKLWVLRDYSSDKLK